MHDAKLFVKILHTHEDLLHHNLDLGLLVESDSQATAFPLDVLSEGHVHHFKDDVEAPVFILDPFSFHHIRTVRTAAQLINLVETLQDLYFSLLHCLLFRLKLVLEAFDCITLPSLDMATFVDVAETAAANQLLLLVLTEQ